MEEPQTKRARLSSPSGPTTEVENNKNDSTDLYLDTIDRHMLDFDFEKVCSVSLSQINVYACLTCGKYYQGRGKSSHAYFHSMDKDHHVFINLQTLKVYVLPDGYEVDNASLNDIKVSYIYIRHLNLLMHVKIVCFEPYFNESSSSPTRYNLENVL
jgi:U4/U6.U5 tri-snRNP-associated protein 2